MAEQIAVKKVLISNKNTQIEYLVSEMKNGHVIFEKKDFDVRKASFFIKSLFLGMPLPQLIGISHDDDIKILKGHEFLSILDAFVNDRFSINGEEFFTELNGKTFSNLQFRFSGVIMEKYIDIYLMSQCTPEEFVNLYSEMTE